MKLFFFIHFIFTRSFTDNLLECILYHTNQEITKKIASLITLGHQPQSYYGEVDKIELEAYFGICFYYALFKENRLSLDCMWSEVFGRGVYHATFSEKRFQFLTSRIRFDDKDTRAKRSSVDKLAPIREIWEIFTKNCTENYEPSNELCIDEQLVSCRGRYFFRIYMKSKPDKYGLKILMMNDVETCYMTAAIPYVGKVIPAEGDDVPAHFMKSLIEKASLNEMSRTITMDDWFTSIPLFESLKKDYNIRAVGTIRKNRRL